VSGTPVTRPVITVDWAPCARPSFASSGRWQSARVTFDGVPVREFTTSWTARDRAAFTSRAKSCLTLEQIKEIT